MLEMIRFLFIEICLCINTFQKHGVVLSSKKPIGIGCSASVYRCTYKGHERAVKVFNDEKRQKREIKMAEYIKTLDLPVIPKIYLATDNIIVMDLVRGENIRVFLNRHRSDRNALKNAVTGMFEAMFAMHRNNIVHGDMHRGNILIGNDSDVKIIDFGESWRDDDFTLDFQRLNRKVLDYIDDWESLVCFNNKADERPFALFKEFCSHYNFQWVFKVASIINTPLLEYYFIQFFRKIFFIMDYDLSSLNERYVRALHSSFQPRGCS